MLFEDRIDAFPFQDIVPVKVPSYPNTSKSYSQNERNFCNRILHSCRIVDWNIFRGFHFHFLGNLAKLQKIQKVFLKIFLKKTIYSNIFSKHKKYTHANIYIL